MHKCRNSLQRAAWSGTVCFSRTWIQHHEGAVTMVSDLFATDGAANDDIAFKMASDIQVDQRTEIRRMKRMLEEIAGKARRAFTTGPTSVPIEAPTMSDRSLSPTMLKLIRRLGPLGLAAGVLVVSACSSSSGSFGAPPSPDPRIGTRGRTLRRGGSDLEPRVGVTEPTAGVVRRLGRTPISRSWGTMRSRATTTA